MLPPSSPLSLGRHGVTGIQSRSSSHCKISRRLSCSAPAIPGRIPSNIRKVVTWPVRRRHCVAAHPRLRCAPPRPPLSLRLLPVSVHWGATGPHCSCRGPYLFRRGAAQRRAPQRGASESRNTSDDSSPPRASLRSSRCRAHCCCCLCICARRIAFVCTATVAA